MSEDSKNLENQNTDVATAAEVSNIDTSEMATTSASEKGPAEDVSNIKISSILSQRLKKRGLNWKTVLAFVLVGVICFAAGIGADRAFTRNRANKMFRNRPGIENRMPMGRFNGKQQNNKDKQKSDKQTPKDKSTTPSNQ